MKMSGPYAPLYADTQPIRTLSVFVCPVAMGFAPKLGKIGAVVVENHQTNTLSMRMGCVSTCKGAYGPRIFIIVGLIRSENYPLQMVYKANQRNH